MKYIRVLYIALLGILISCKSEKIPQREMPLLIAEIYKVDRFINSNYNLVIKADTTRIYESVLNKHGYSSKQFVYTIEHYLSRPAKLKSFYSKAKQLIEEEERALQERIDKIKREDSLASPYKKIVENSSKITALTLKERSVRWLMLPNVYPSFLPTPNEDSEFRFTTPNMVDWWAENFKKDSIQPIFKGKYEKNSSTIPLPTQLLQADPQGDDNSQPRRGDNRDRRVNRGERIDRVL